MEIRLDYISTDSLLLPKNHSRGKDEALTLKEIRRNLKDNYLFFHNIDNEEYYDIEVFNINNNASNENEITINIKCKEKLAQDLKESITNCMEKELKLIQKQNDFKKICENFEVNKDLLSKKLFSYIEYDISDYEDIYNKIVEKFLDYRTLMSELNAIESKLIKYKESEIFCLYFKIYINRVKNLVDYLFTKEILLLNNEKLFNTVVDISLEIISKIIIQTNDYVLSKIIDNPIYKNNKEEYDKKFDLIKEMFSLFPLLKFFDNSNKEYEIFNLDRDITLDLSEVEYGKILQVSSQIPKTQGLNATFSYFKEHTNYKQTFGMSLRRMLLVHNKYKITYPDFIRSSFLYGK